MVDLFSKTSIRLAIIVEEICGAINPTSKDIHRGVGTGGGGGGGDRVGRPPLFGGRFYTFHI